MSWVFALDDVALISWICWKKVNDFTALDLTCENATVDCSSMLLCHPCTMHRLNDAASEDSESTVENYEPIKYHF